MLIVAKDLPGHDKDLLLLLLQLSYPLCSSQHTASKVFGAVVLKPYSL